MTLRGVIQDCTSRVTAKSAMGSPLTIDQPVSQNWMTLSSREPSMHRAMVAGSAERKVEYKVRPKERRVKARYRISILL